MLRLLVSPSEICTYFAVRAQVENTQLLFQILRILGFFATVAVDFVTRLPR